MNVYFWWETYRNENKNSFVDGKIHQRNITYITMEYLMTIVHFKNNLYEVIIFFYITSEKNSVFRYMKQLESYDK